MRPARFRAVGRSRKKTADRPRRYRAKHINRQGRYRDPGLFAKPHHVEVVETPLVAVGVLWHMTAMEQSDIPDDLRRKAEASHRAHLEEAFRAGYERGLADATQRIISAARGMAEGTSSAKAISAPTGASERVSSQEKPHPNAADARRFPYGAVTNAFRAVLKRAGALGYQYPHLIKLVSAELGEDVSDMKHRDTIKRLKKDDQLRIKDGYYIAGPRLRNQNENGAAETAPDADEAATSSTDSQGRLDVVG